MATLRRENPTIHVCTSGSEAIVHIRQFTYTDDDQTSFKESQDGVKMTLMQFRSLMFHLRALDMQFTQNSENKLTTTCSGMSPSSSSGVGKKRTQDMMNGSESNVSIVNVEQQGDINQNNNTSDIPWGELDTLLASFTAKDTANDTLTESESSNVTTNVESVHVPTLTMSQKDVRDELAIGYAEEIINLNLLPRFTYSECIGCKNGVDKNTNIEQHHICTLPRKKRIEMFIDMAVLMVGSVTVQEKVAERLKSRNVVFNEKWINEPRYSLIASKKWMHQLKSNLLNM